MSSPKTRVISEKPSTHGTPDKDIWLARWDVGGNIREEKCSRRGEREFYAVSSDSKIYATSWHSSVYRLEAVWGVRRAVA